MTNRWRRHVMHKIEQGVGSVVAADTRTTMASVDATYLAQARMAASIVEAATASDLPAGATQELLEAVTDSMTQVVAGRTKLIKALSQLQQIQSKSNLREVGFGCPGGLPSQASLAAQNEQITP
ncbi:hypothetical protein ATE76_01390 [Sphingopyxis sp. H093]|nr:hypothetical protein ATE76_01390 [Sphingopyxis sp. H093]KTE28581.1 hypothetical protein ATE75_11845 [Sphingopyxis sp. H080]